MRSVARAVSWTNPLYISPVRATRVKERGCIPNTGFDVTLLGSNGAANRSESNDMYVLNVNGERRSVDVPADMPLLWVLRDIVGLTASGQKVQQAWLDIDVVQCGYCQSGQIMSAAALLARTSNPSDADIDA